MQIAKWKLKIEISKKKVEDCLHKNVKKSDFTFCTLHFLFCNSKLR